MKRHQDTFTDDETYPVTASASGRNAYHFRCEAVGHCAPYASCLKKIEDRKQGRLETIYATCSAEIGRRDCPAQAMRKEELAKGTAIYYLDRVKMREFYQGEDAALAPTVKPAPVWQPPSRQVWSTKSAEPVRASTHAPAPPPVAPRNDFAAAINAAIAATQEPTKKRSLVTSTPEPPRAKIVHASGQRMTPLELARMRASQ